MRYICPVGPVFVSRAVYGAHVKVNLLEAKFLKLLGYVGTPTLGCDCAAATALGALSA